jgi:hypothetical protein
MLEGLIVLGVGLLATARAFARDAGAANRQLLGERRAEIQTRASVGFGVALGVVAIVAGTIWAISAAM